MKKNLLAAFFLCVFLCGGYSYSQTKDELLSNPGFESGMNGWELSSQYPGVCEISKTDVKEGTQCIYIENNRGGGPTYFQTKNLIAVTKADIIELKCWAKGKGRITFTLGAFGTKGSSQGFLQSIWSDDYELTPEWKEYTWRYAVNSNKISMLRFMLLLRNNSYKAYVDACSAKKISENISESEPSKRLSHVNINASEALNETFAPGNMIDSNPDTAWVAKEMQSWVIVELDSVHTVNALYWERTGKSLAERSLVDYNIQTSLDGKTFTTVKEVRGNVRIAGTDYFRPTKAKYVKLNIIITRQSPASIGELKVFEGTQLVQENTGTSTKIKKDIGVTKFKSKKMLYDFNEKGYVNLIITNTSASDFSINYVITEQWGTREKRTIATNKFDLKASAVFKATYDIPIGKEEFGHHVGIEIKDSQDRVLANAEDVYEVAHNWIKLSRASSYVNMFTPNASTSAYDYEIEELRKSYINEIEIFAISELNSIQHPDGSKKQYTTEMYGDVVYSKLKLFVDKCHENGIKVRSYNHMPSANIDFLSDKDAICYGPYDPRNMPYFMPWSYGEYKWPVATPVLDDELPNKKNVFINQLVHKKYFAKEFANSIKAVGWDSIYFDAFLRSICNPCIAKNNWGKPLTSLSVDEIGADVLGYYYQEFRKVKDNFYIFPSINFCGAMEPLAPDFVSDRHAMMEWKKKIKLPKVAKIADVWAIEIHLHEKAKAHSPAATRWPTKYESLQVTFHGLRENANTTVSSVASWTQPGYFTVQQVKPMYAILLSSGVAVWDFQHGERNDIVDAKATQAVRDYLRFAARYGEYLYGTNIKWPKDDIVSVKAPERVYWRNTYFEKITEEGKEIYVHLINLPENHYLWFEDRNVPEPVKDAEITVNAQNGYKIDSVTWMTPDNNQDCQKLQFEEKSGKIKFTIPNIEYWSIGVLKFKKSK